MRYYETLYIVNPNYEQERLTDVIETVAEEVKKSSVKIIEQIVWGKKRLAYRIQNHKYGTFILLKLETENLNFLIDFNMFMKLNKAIIRAQTIRLDEKPILAKEIKVNEKNMDEAVKAKEDTSLVTAVVAGAEEDTSVVKDAATEDSSEPKDEKKENEREKPAEETPVVRTDSKTGIVDIDKDKEKAETQETEKENPELESDSEPGPEEDQSSDQDDNDASQGKEEKEEK
jgi:small subunit ribosomal protein S6